MFPTSEPTRCVTDDQCAFDRRCEGFITCAEVDPRGLDLQLKVYIPGGKVYCADADCDHAFALPIGSVTIEQIVEAAKTHEAEWHE